MLLPVNEHATVNTQTGLAERRRAGRVANLLEGEVVGRGVRAQLRRVCMWQHASRSDLDGPRPLGAVEHLQVKRLKGVVVELLEVRADWNRVQQRPAMDRDRSAVPSARRRPTVPHPLYAGTMRISGLKLIMTVTCCTLISTCNKASAHK